MADGWAGKGLNMEYSSVKKLDITACLSMLSRWMDYAEHMWYPIPGRPSLGCYGTGYNSWAVQTNQKYLSAMAMLAAKGSERALDRAMAALRFSLDSHKSGDFHCTDGTKWGHTWISALGIERMMYGVHHLEPHFTLQDRESLQKVLVSESNWLLNSHERYGHKGIFGEIWEVHGKNHPESNLWNGALLWRTAVMYPEEPLAAAWKERAHEFLINGISVPADAENSTVLAGKQVKERFIGANFFPNFALDHRGFMNLGYMVICASNAAMLHFDLRLQGLDAPETLYHHLGDLWGTIRRMIFPNGRMARIGGDDRIRNTYTQEYLLPALLLAADRFEDPHAMELAEGYLRMADSEQIHHGDGGFYTKRLKKLEEINPYYSTRLEADRACVLGMAVAYSPLVQAPGVSKTPQKTISFEDSVTGLWCEPEHGSVMHRSPTRFASFAWRALGLTQGLCQPPDNPHIAEWDRNLGGIVEAVHHVYENRIKEQLLYPHLIMKPTLPHRGLRGCHVETFKGGFITWGSVVEGTNIEIADAWSGTDTALHQIVYIALPDDHTVVGLQYCRTAPRRTYFREIQGLHFNLPNDFYNDYRRNLVTENNQFRLEGVPEKDEIKALESRWVNIDDCLGIIGLYGAQSLSMRRFCPHSRRRGEFSTINIEEIAWSIRTGCIAVDPDQVILDVGWMVVSSADTDQTRQAAMINSNSRFQTNKPDIRTLEIRDFYGKKYIIAANFGSSVQDITFDQELTDMVTLKRLGETESALLNPGSAAIYQVT
jgi:hypothetical protein